MASGMHDLISRPTSGYRLLDSGAGAKLEELGGVLVQRPCAQAIWPRQRSEASWQAARSICERTPDGGGRWRHHGASPGGLFEWRHGSARIALQLRCTEFGHCGVFFEQLPMWTLIVEELARAPAGSGFANLFGYTGAASVAAAACGARVFHVDSARGVLDWGRANAQASGLAADRIKWIHDDARSFLALSRKRGFRYHCVLADPPAWGHGKDSTTWQFEDHVAELIAHLGDVLEPGGLLLFTTHTPGVQRATLENLLSAAGLKLEGAGELGIAHAEDARILPAGLWSAARRPAP